MAGQVRSAPAHSQRGSAILVALGAIVLISALGAGLIVVSNTERRIAANFHAAAEARYAAEAVLERALVDVRRAPDLTALLSGGVAPTFADAGLQPPAPWGGSLDLAALTAALQAASDAAGAGNPNRPRWRLLAYGPIARLSAAGSIRSVLYGAAWVADDPGEADGDALDDSNGVVVLVAQALGPLNVRRTVRATVAGPGVIRLLSWRIDD